MEFVVVVVMLLLRLEFEVEGDVVEAEVSGGEV